jgi:diaminohydroxyphosphoribosylaminopyrimidine deaminase / 5-amino-6-(5-phosphoribosylamino)uracil reductase
MDQDQRFMQRALALAERGRGRTSPNPMVGCVVVRDGQVLGEGFHEKAGGPHAEVHALRAAGNAVGATLYTSLEPCCFQGRTPPCTDLIIAHGLARVVAAMQDPNPRVSGQGFRRLLDAGIDVQVGMLEEEAHLLNEAFCKYIRTGMPLVIAKCGMSLDGKIATRTGESRWITGECSRRRVHELRNQVDAILVGSRTVLRDNPSLTVRLETGKVVKDPICVVVDDGENLSSAARLFCRQSDAPVWVALPEGREFQGADEVLQIPAGPGGLDMRQLMRELGRREVTSLLVEGGGATLASAFESGVVDKILFFIAPKIIGGAEAVTPVEGRGAAGLDEAIRLERMRSFPLGEDILIEAYVHGHY